MVWNFAREELGTTIACSTVTLDGHEAQKLLQQPSASSSSSVLPSFSQQQQPTHSSFICSHFVKPPVDLLLCFPEEISICSVVVGHRVHTHCMQVVSLEVCAAGAEHTRQQQQEEWTFLGNYADLHRFKENGIRFFHPNRSQRYMNEQQKSSLAAIPFSRSLRALHRVKKLRLTIKKTYQGKAVACAFLQVWGELSHRSSSTSKTLLSRLHQLSSSEQTNTSSIELQHSISSATRNNNDTIHDGEEEEEKELSRRAVTIATHKIPPCYIDPITCELMLHPVVLPSGHHIDASTLNRHLERHSTDPFTGLSMRKNQIKVDTSLQSEIRTFIRNNAFNEKMIEPEHKQTMIASLCQLHRPPSSSSSPSSCSPSSCSSSSASSSSSSSNHVAFSGRGFRLGTTSKRPTPEDDGQKVVYLQKKPRMYHQRPHSSSPPPLIIVIDDSDDEGQEKEKEQENENENEAKNSCVWCHKEGTMLLRCGHVGCRACVSNSLCEDVDQQVTKKKLLRCNRCGHTCTRDEIQHKRFL